MEREENSSTRKIRQSHKPCSLRGTRGCLTYFFQHLAVLPEVLDRIVLLAWNTILNLKGIYVIQWVTHYYWISLPINLLTRGSEQRPGERNSRWTQCLYKLLIIFHSFGTTICFYASTSFAIHLTFCQSFLSRNSFRDVNGYSPKFRRLWCRHRCWEWDGIFKLLLVLSIYYFLLCFLLKKGKV